MNNIFCVESNVMDCRFGVEVAVVIIMEEGGLVAMVLVGGIVARALAGGIVLVGGVIDDDDDVVVDGGGVALLVDLDSTFLSNSFFFSFSLFLIPFPLFSDILVRYDCFKKEPLLLLNDDDDDAEFCCCCCRSLAFCISC